MNEEEIEIRHDRRERDVNRSIDQVEHQIKALAEERISDAGHILNRVREMTADHLPDVAFVSVIKVVKILVMEADSATLAKASEEVSGIY